MPQVKHTFEMQLWWKKEKKQAQPVTGLTWDPQASQALEMALAQAPVPAMLKNRVKSELQKTAEETTRAAGRTTVTAEDLVTGMMAKLPPDMQQKAKDLIDKKIQK